MVDVLRAVVPERSGVYVSAPITSGKRYFALQERLQEGRRGLVNIDTDTLEREVIAPNVAETAKLVGVVRERFGPLVIDPSPLVVPRWRQRNYIALWAAVVRRYARLVIFSEGWQFSSGCTYEFVVACEEGIAMLGAHLEPLSRERGIELVASAKDELDAHGFDASYLGERLEQLRQTNVHRTVLADTTDIRNRSEFCALMLGTVVLPHATIVVCSAGSLANDGFAAGLRRRGRLVIDTAAFAPPSWSRDELRKLWSRVVEAYAVQLVIDDALEVNEKCADVLAAAAKAGIAVVDRAGRRV
jgi:hypothetical protein